MLANKSAAQPHSGLLCRSPAASHKRVVLWAAHKQTQQHSSDNGSHCSSRSRSSSGGHLDAQQQQQLRVAVVATAVCCAFVSNVGAARAADSWIPRRHHRHIGERFTDTWADSIVEASGLLCCCQNSWDQHALMLFGSNTSSCLYSATAWAGRDCRCELRHALCNHW